ncbi:MAG: cofactor-independent phosphoglycerate mutase [Oscillospiraceae bacterium]
MKYIVMLGDGMADWAVPELGGKTPLEVAKKPMMDFLAQHGETGMVKTVPLGMPPGSDTANLSVMGYAPEVYYSGRSPLEAVSMGIKLDATDVTFRCNLVNLDIDGEYENGTMVDYSSDEISTAESTILINYLNEHFKTDSLNLYPGISYRHCLVLKNAKIGSECTPPHDISLKPIKEHLPKGLYGEKLLSMMKQSYDLLKDHPVNKAREAKGLKPANSCWFWGEGTKPALSSFSEKFGVKGAVISAVDLIKGIGICAGLESIDVDGVTGNINTNFVGKGKAAIKALADGNDFVYIHVEAPDESGHRHEVDNKVKSIEEIDEKILTPIVNAMRASGEEFAILLTPDHPTPLEIRTHCSDPVPFVIYRSANENPSHTATEYTEAAAKATGLYLEKGDMLMKRLILGE